MWFYTMISYVKGVGKNTSSDLIPNIFLKTFWNVKMFKTFKLIAGSYVIQKYQPNRMEM